MLFVDKLYNLYKIYPSVSMFCSILLYSLLSLVGFVFNQSNLIMSPFVLVIFPFREKTSTKRWNQRCLFFKSKLNFFCERSTFQFLNFLTRVTSKNLSFQYLEGFTCLHTIPLDIFEDQNTLSKKLELCGTP